MMVIATICLERKTITATLLLGVMVMVCSVIVVVMFVVV